MHVGACVFASVYAHVRLMERVSAATQVDQTRSAEGAGYVSGEGVRTCVDAGQRGVCSSAFLAVAPAAFCSCYRHFIVMAPRGTKSQSLTLAGSASKASEMLRTTKQEICAYLDAHLDEAAMCLKLLQDGAARFNKKELDKSLSPIPKTTCQMRYVSQDLWKRALQNAHSKLTPLFLKKIAKASPAKSIYHLAWFAFGAEEGDWVFDHDPARFLAGLQQQYEAMGKRLSKITIPSNCVLDWARNGCYEFKLVGKTAEGIRHVSGKEVASEFGAGPTRRCF